MSIKRLNFQTSKDCALTFQVRPIGGVDLAMVHAAMAEVAPDWSVELLDTSADDSSLLIVPDDGDDATGPSFMISRESYGFRVDQVHWDVVTEVGIFRSMGDVVDALQLRLAFSDGLGAPGSATVH